MFFVILSLRDLIITCRKLKINDTAVFTNRVLEPLSTLSTIVLGDSEIDRLSPGFFNFSNNWFALAILGSSIDKIEENAFDSLPLTQLTIVFCEINSLPFNLGVLPNIQSL